MAATGQPLPIEWQNPPNPAIELVGYWDAFMELSTCRQLGMSFGPIPFTAVKEYAGLYEIAGVRFQVLNRLVRAMDRAYLSFFHEKQKRDSK